MAIAGVGRVELEQRLPGGDGVGLARVHREDGAGDVGRHLHDGAADVGVVGGHAPARVTEPVHGPGRASQQDAHGQDGEVATAWGAGGLTGRLGVRGAHSIFSFGPARRPRPAAPVCISWKLPPSATSSAMRASVRSASRLTRCRRAREHLRLGVEDGEEVAEPGAVALHGQPPALLGGVERALLVGELPVEGLDSRGLVGRLAHGAQHGLVVARDRRVEVGRGLAVFGRRRPASKIGQVNRGAQASRSASRPWAGLSRPTAVKPAKPIRFTFG